MRPIQRWTAAAASSRLTLHAIPLLALCFLVVTIASQYFFYGRYDPYRCRALLNTGTWVRSPPRSDALSPPVYDGSRRSRSVSASLSSGASNPFAFARWEPGSCRLHQYSHFDIQACLFRRRLVFVGDSTVRQVFWAAAARLDRPRADEAKLNFFVLDDKQVDLSFEADGVTLEFVYDPWLNSSSLLGQLARFRHSKEDKESAALLLVAAPGLWPARHGGYDFFELFKDGVALVEPFAQGSLDEAAKLPRGHPSAAYGELANHVVLAPVTSPLYENLSPRRKTTITPERLNKLNEHLDHLPAAERSHIAFVFNQMTKGNASAYNQDGLHVHDAVAGWRLDIALNARCNAALARQEGYANALTCCVAYAPTVSIQRVMLLLSFVSAIYIALSSCVRTSQALRGDILGATATLLAVAGYPYLTDRTHLFSKVDKLFVPSYLSVCILVFVGISLSSLTRFDWREFSTKGKDGPSLPRGKDKDVPFVPRGKDVPFLSRGQTDEWKGWLQGLLLMINYHGASQSLVWYKVGRILGSMFVFLFVYGHTTYVLRTRDFSLRRFTTIMARLNLLPILLSFAMGTEWITYHFMPLATFWFVILWVALASLREYNDNPSLLIFKIFITAFITNILIIPHLLSAVVGVASVTCGVSWDAESLRLSIGLDRFIPYFAMIGAAMAHRDTVLKRQHSRIPKTQPFSNLNNLFDTGLLELLYPSPQNEPVFALTIMVSVAGVFITLMIVLSDGIFTSEDYYDGYHPYLSCCAVTSAIILRNCHKLLRQTSFQIPAMLGQISLELYVLQHHIWQSGDGSGSLRIGLGGLRRGVFPSLCRASDAIVLTIVFVWTCAKTREATAKIVDRLADIAGPARIAKGSSTMDPEEKERVRRESSGSSLEYQPTPSASSAVQGKMGRLRSRPAMGFGLLVLLWLASLLYGSPF